MAGDRDSQVDRDLPGRSDNASTSEASPRRSRRASSNGGRRAERESPSGAALADVENGGGSKKRRGGAAVAEDDRPSGGRGEASDGVTRADLNELLAGLRDLRSGDFAVRLPRSRDPVMADIVSAFNDVASRN